MAQVVTAKTVTDKLAKLNELGYSLKDLNLFIKDNALGEQIDPRHINVLFMLEGEDRFQEYAELDVINDQIEEFVTNWVEA